MIISKRKFNEAIENARMEESKEHWRQEQMRVLCGKVESLEADIRNLYARNPGSVADDGPVVRCRHCGSVLERL